MSGYVGLGWVVWFGLVWFGLVWFGLVWFGGIVSLVLFQVILVPSSDPLVIITTSDGLVLTMDLYFFK